MDKHSICSFTLIGISLVLLMGAREQCEVININVKNKDFKLFSDFKEREFPHLYSLSLEKSFKVDNPETFGFGLQNSEGNITVKEEDIKEIKVSIKENFYGNFNKKFRSLENYPQTISYEESESALNIKVLSQEELAKVFGADKIDFHFVTDFIVTVPKGLKDVSIMSTSGEVKADLTSKLNIATTNGDIRAKVEDNDAEFLSTNGDIGFTHIRGRISLSNTNGDIVGDIDSSLINFSGTNGDIKVVLKNLQGGEIALSNGDIETHIRDTKNLRISAYTSRGDIKTDLKNVTKSDNGKEISAVIGKPDKELKIQNSNGDIKIITIKKKS
ncbi:MAG: DUF4097 family beta strand repeat-containing protein [bacterium]|nr:DUF4097 family beta strand repeat-containing protein [bacterium]